MKWLTLGTMVLSLCLSTAGAAPANAQAIPPGTYLNSCTDMAVTPILWGIGIMTANCRTPGTGVVRSSIQLPCVGSVDNINGILQCTPPSTANMPTGAYLSSCTNIQVVLQTLMATCKGVGGAYHELVDFETTLRLPCTGTVSNFNGQLKCDAIPQVDARVIVTQFAPVLRFRPDSDGFGYPMSANEFWSRWTAAGTRNEGIGSDAFGLVENTDPNTVTSGQAPTYYQYQKFGNQVRINYWWFYGYQHPCWSNHGSHQADWEHIMVILTEDQSRVAAVQYYQHGQSYLRISGPRDAPCTPSGTGRCEMNGFESVGLRPVVYVGRTAKGAYHDTYGGVEGAGSCFYYGDARGGDGPVLNTSQLLVDLDGTAEAWLAADRASQFSNWGPDGISTHPTQDAPTADMSACSGSPTYAFNDAGCYKSEALAGDDQASQNGIKECRHGYDNVGLTCNKGVNPIDWRIYGRLSGGNMYTYDYRIPTIDAGLSRRRGADSEWDLP